MEASKNSGEIIKAIWCSPQTVKSLLQKTTPAYLIEQEQVILVPN